jgi:hypothetical protein
MTFEISTENGWTEVILDSDGEFEQFTDIAAMLETKYQLIFSEKLNNGDTWYWDFHFNNSILVLCYNVYMGISLFPRAFANATETDNENVLTVADLIHEGE